MIKVKSIVEIITECDKKRYEQRTSFTFWLPRRVKSSI